jgi:hypothetical protein
MNSRVRTFRLPPELDAQVDSYLQAQGKTLTQWLHDLMRRELDRAAEAVARHLRQEAAWEGYLRAEAPPLPPLPPRRS